MSNNITILDSTSATQTVITTQVAGVHIPHHSLDDGAGNVIGVSADPIYANIITNSAPPLNTVSRLIPAIINASASGVISLVGGISTKTIRVFSIMFTISGATVITLEDGTTPLTGAFSYSGASIFQLPALNNVDPLFTTSSGNNFVLNSTNSVSFQGILWYTQS